MYEDIDAAARAVDGKRLRRVGQIGGDSPEGGADCWSAGFRE